MTASPLASPLTRPLSAGAGQGGIGLPSGVLVALPGSRTSFNIEDAFGVVLTPASADVLVGFDGGPQVRQKAGTTEIHGPPLYALTVDAQAVSSPTVFTVTNSASLPEYLGAAKCFTFNSIGVFGIRLPRTVTRPVSLVMEMCPVAETTASTVIYGGLYPALNDDNPSVQIRQTSTLLIGRVSNNAASAAVMSHVHPSVNGPQWWRAAMCVDSSGTISLFRHTVATSISATTTISTAGGSTIDADLNFLVLGGTPTSGSAPITRGTMIGRCMVTNHILSTTEFINLSWDQPRPWPHELTDPANCVEYLDPRAVRPWQSRMSGRPLTFVNVGGGASANVAVTSISGSGAPDFRSVNRLSGAADSITIPSTEGSLSAMSTCDSGVRRALANASVNYEGASGASASAGGFGQVSAGVDFMFSQQRSPSAYSSAGNNVPANFGVLRYDLPQYTYPATYSATTTVVNFTYVTTGATREVRVTRPMLAGAYTPALQQRVVIFSHGAQGNHSLYSGIRDRLTPRGTVVIQPNHADASAEGGGGSASGDTSDWEKRGREFNELVTRVAAGELASTTVNGERIVLGGHSFGCDTVFQAVGVTYDGSAATVGSVNPAVIGAFFMSPTAQGEGRLTPSGTESFRKVPISILCMTGDRDSFGAEADYRERRRIFDNNQQQSWLSVLRNGNHGHGRLTDSQNFFFDYHDYEITSDMILAAVDHFFDIQPPTANMPASWWLNNGMWQRLMPAQFVSYEFKPGTESVADTRYDFSAAGYNRYPIPTGATQLTFQSTADFYLNFGTSDVAAGGPNMYFANTDATGSGETFNLKPTWTHFALRAVQTDGYLVPLSQSSVGYKTYAGGGSRYPDCSAVNQLYDASTSAVTGTLPTHTGLLRMYVPTSGTAHVIFGTASASFNTNSSASAGNKFNPGTYLVSASGCTHFAVLGQQAGQFTLNICALVSVS